MPTTNFIWDPLNDSYMMETDENGATTAVYTQEPSPFGGVISQDGRGDVSYGQQDKLGSTRLLTDGSGAVAGTFNYDAWGNEISRSGATNTPFLWVGKKGYYFDQDLACYYIRARIFDEIDMRWTSPDRSGFLDSTNLYLFARNSPLIYLDVTGLTATIVDADAFIPWDWVNIPPDPRAAALAFGLGALWWLTQSYVKGDNRNPSATPMRNAQTRMHNFIDVETCACSTKDDAKTFSFAGISPSERKDILFWPLGYSREYYSQDIGTIQSIELAPTKTTTKGCLTTITLKGQGNVPFKVALLNVGINYDYTITLHHHGRIVDWAVQATHDGFPGHEFYLRIAGNVINKHTFVPPGSGWTDSPGRLAGFIDPQSYSAKGTVDVADACC